MNLLKRQLSVANVISCIALFVALSGVAYAATTIGNKSVKTQHLGNGSVTTLKLRNGAVSTAKIRNMAVNAAKLGPGAVVAEKIANGAVRSAALGGGVVTDGKLKNGAVTGDKLASGVVTNSKLGADAVTAGKIQNGAVSSAKLLPALLAQLVKDVSYVPGASPSNTTEATKTATAACPSGKQVVGGGVKLVGGDQPILITESGPSVANAQGKHTGWTAVAKESGPNTVAWSVEATAICAGF